MFLYPPLAAELKPPNCEKRGVLITWPFFWLLSVGLRGLAEPRGLKSSIMIPYICGVKEGAPAPGIPPAGAGGGTGADIPGIVGA